jgi:imidazolonepropionase-like amidohydrolase
MANAGAAGFAVVAESWFDGERRHCAPATILVRDGRVAELSHGDHGAELAKRGLALARGGFLMPGLVDAHVHLLVDGALTDPKLRSAHLKQPLEALVGAARKSARQALRCGVTALRDAGDRHGINNRIRTEAFDPASGLPQVRSGGSGIKRAGRYGEFIAKDVGARPDIVRAVKELAAENDEIKIVLTGIVDFEAGAAGGEPQFTLEETKLIVATARAAGRRTLAHCSGAPGLAIAAGAGVGSIEHGFFMDRATLALMARKGIAWTPTFSPLHFQWAHPEAAGWSPQAVGNLRRILDSHARHLALAQAMGVPVLLGTDAGSMGVEHGRAVAGEIRCFLDAGLSLEDALKAATSTPRRHFNAASPRLETGVPFDAILLRKSPFEDFTALLRPLRVWRGGLKT